MDGGHQENSKTTNHTHIDWLNPRSIPRPWQAGFFWSSLPLKFACFQGQTAISQLNAEGGPIAK